MRSRLAALASGLRTDGVIVAEALGTIATLLSLPFLIPLVTGGRYDLGVLLFFKARFIFDNEAWSAAAPALVLAIILGLVVAVIIWLVLRLVSLILEIALAVGPRR